MPFSFFQVAIMMGSLANWFCPKDGLDKIVAEPIIPDVWRKVLLFKFMNHLGIKNINYLGIMSQMCKIVFL